MIEMTAKTTFYLILLLLIAVVRVRMLPPPSLSACTYQEDTDQSTCDQQCTALCQCASKNGFQNAGPTGQCSDNPVRCPAIPPTPSTLCTCLQY